MKPIIGIVSPCYNEELVINETSLQLVKKLTELVSKQLINEQSFIAKYK